MTTTYPHLTTKPNNPNWDDWSANQINAVVNGVKNQSYSYLIYELDGIYYARNGITGTNDFYDADGTTVTQDCVNALRGTGTGPRDASGKIELACLVPITHLDLTNARNLRFVGLASKPMYAPTYDIPKYGFNITSTSGVGIDALGAVGLQFSDLTITSATVPDIFLLLGRTSLAASTGNHIFSNVVFEGAANLTQLYNYASEVNSYNNVKFNNTQGYSVIISAKNEFSVTSSFQTIASGTQSCNQNYFTDSFFLNYGSTGENLVYLEGCLETIFTRCYSSAPEGFLVKASNQSSLQHTIFRDCHFEQGGIITVDAAGDYTVFYGLTISGGYIANLQMKLVSAVPVAIDLNKNNIGIYNLNIDKLTSGNGVYFQFWAVFAPTIFAADSLNQIHFAATWNGGLILVYSRAMLDGGVTTTQVFNAVA
jgi:hypothetical protein